MELQEVIEKRRSIRTFTNRPVSKEKILAILESARIAPSAKNRQPWKIYVSKGQTKDTIANYMIGYAESNGIKKHAGMISTAKAIKEAPILLLLFKDNKEILKKRNDTLSIGAAIENMLLKATELNLGSLWICAMFNVRDKISQLINTDLELYSCVAIGYPNEQPCPRPRKSLDEIVMNLDNI